MAASSLIATLSRWLLILQFVLLLTSGTFVSPTLGQQNGELLNQTIEQSGNKPPQQQQQQVSKIQYLNVNGLPVLVQFTYVGPPKILPIATADSYPEGSLINLICTVSGGQRRGLTLSWTVNGIELDEHNSKYGSQASKKMFDNVSIGADDADISILKIKNATSHNSGMYTCQAKNPLGQDSTSVKIVINVELKWNKIPKDAELGLNQELSIECDAVGSPSPTIEWFKHSTIDRSGSSSNGTVLVAKGKLLKISKAQHKDSGLYECLAKNGVDEDLRKIIQVKVRGK